MGDHTRTGCQACDDVLAVHVTGLQWVGWERSGVMRKHPCLHYLPLHWNGGAIGETGWSGTLCTRDMSVPKSRDSGVKDIHKSFCCRK